jgi:hypothetical protein
MLSENKPQNMRRSKKNAFERNIYEPPTKCLWTASGPWTMCRETLAKMSVQTRPYVCNQPQE